MQGVTATAQSGVAMPRRSSLRIIGKTIADPLSSLPPEVYDHRLVVMRNFGRLRAYVVDPALIQQALVGEADALDKSYETKRVLQPALGTGLLTADGTHWRWQRQALAPAFQPAKLAALVPAMISAADATRDRLLALAPGSLVDLGHEMTQTTFKIIVDTMLSGPSGLDTGAIERNMGDYLGATPFMFALALLRAPKWVPFPGRGRAMRAAGAMRASIEAMIAARRRRDAGGDDLVALLLAAQDPDSGRRMSDGEIADNILTFVTAGHETTALALGWASALLARNPEQEQRMLDEISEVAGDGPILPEHVARLDITRRVVNETLRLYPPAPIIARATRRAFVLADVPIPAGSSILVPIHAVHRQAAIWPRPERFEPDRFAPEAAKGRHRYAFMPFGAGPRICIGSAFATTEAVAILAILVRALRIEPVGVDLPSTRMRVTLRPATPLRLRVSPR